VYSRVKQAVGFWPIAVLYMYRLQLAVQCAHVQFSSLPYRPTTIDTSTDWES